MNVYVTRYSQSTNVVIPNISKLTPKSARQALIVAFGNDRGGEVVDTETNRAYRVSDSGKSVRKIDW